MQGALLNCTCYLVLLHMDNTLIYLLRYRSIKSNVCQAHVQAENKGHGIVIVALETEVVSERDARIEAERQLEQVTLQDLVVS